MVNKDVFKNKAIEIINTIKTNEQANILSASRIIADCIKSGGVVHLYGSGHSSGLGMDITGRPGCLIPIHIMDMNDFVFKGGVSIDEFISVEDPFERKPNMANKLLDLYDIKNEDVFIITSNSGINGIVIDIAEIAKSKGNKIIVICSMDHTLKEKSRHPSGKKLYEFADVTIDTCCPHGDALLETSTDIKVCASSSIANNCIAQCLAINTIDILSKEMKDIPILSEDETKNKIIMSNYKDRI